jgi:hypothetical protein
VLHPPASHINQNTGLLEALFVLRALSPICLAKPETASCVRQRIATVLDWAKAAGFRIGDNPTAGVGKDCPRSNYQETQATDNRIADW